MSSIARSLRRTPFSVSRFLVPVILIFSGSAKLFSADYTADLFIQMLGFRWVELFYLEIIKWTVYLVAVSEIMVGAAIFKVELFYKLKPTLMIFLLLMLIINGIQWYRGAIDCGCFGGVIKLPPEWTAIKSLVLLLLIHKTEGEKK